MEHPELIQPGDHVFMAVPPNMNQPPEEVAEALDGTYPGVDFEVFEADGQVRPEIIFTYRDPRALGAWLEDQKIDKADTVVGLTLDQETTRHLTNLNAGPIIQ
jgi:hypothetical protein